jgi:sugar phosphate isomerase/epimerase
MPMSPEVQARRALGTMVTYGFVEGGLAVDLAIAQRLGASVVEILPDWRVFPDPKRLSAEVEEAGLAVHSAHGCWGGQSIEAPRVDLGSTDPGTHAASLADLQRCVDWLAEAGGTCLVVHPGCLSDAEEFPLRREALQTGLLRLAEHARGTGVVLCVENMPPGVHPGSRMDELTLLVQEIDQPKGVALALDTGHGNLTSSAANETRGAGKWLRTTHVHDNDGRSDTHLPPGLGTVDWDSWAESLDSIGYRGPVMLECIRHLRRYPETLTDDLLGLLARLTRVRRV